MNRFFIFSISILFSTACGLGPDMSRDRIPPSPSPTPFVAEKPVAEYLRDGDSEYADKDFAGAIPHYKRAFEIEQREQKLDKNLRNVLIDSLAMSYVLSGDQTNARVVLAYGLSKDFSYPMFHYILARSYGQEGNEAEAIYRLSKAYEHDKKLGKGRDLPDPITDDSFAAFSESETFKKAVAQMKRGR